jgi:aromatic-L-amino-acid/L-tryptophan decarboxylase
MPPLFRRFRKAGYRAVDRICDYYASLSERPVLAQVKPGYLTSALPHEAPQKGESMDAIADDFQTLILPGITHWQHPSFFAYVRLISRVDFMTLIIQLVSL